MKPLLAVVAALALLPPAAAAQDISLSAPVACPPGVRCLVQNLFDHDPGPGVRDFRCTALAYDGHDGTDIRAPSMAAQRAGVDVLAAADGVVRGGRDGMADVGIAGAPRDALKNVECGNGVVLTHEGGWETQYCHMAKGSVAVKPGDAVKRGQKLGRVGLSGKTEFAHLHLSVRRDGKKIDPYAPDGATEGCAAGRTLWAPDAVTAMRVSAPAVLNAGFAAGPVTQEQVESGALDGNPVGRDPEALVAFARVIGLATGDVVAVTLIGPGGAALARNAGAPMPNPKAQWMAFSGVKRPPAGWPRGVYRSRAEIIRKGAALTREDVTLEIGG